MIHTRSFAPRCGAKTAVDGMGQRPGNAAALLSDPETLTLDEPAYGLDPEGVARFRQLARGQGA